MLRNYKCVEARQRKSDYVKSFYCYEQAYLSVQTEIFFFFQECAVYVITAGRCKQRCRSIFLFMLVDVFALCQIQIMSSEASICRMDKNGFLLQQRINYSERGLGFVPCIPMTAKGFEWLIIWMQPVSFWILISIPR